MRRYIKITFASGETLSTWINGSESEILAYYIGQKFNLGIGPQDRWDTATDVEFLQ